MNVDPTHVASLFENATEGLILTNGQGNIVLINPAAQRMFGYKAAEIIGQPVEVLIPQRFTDHHQKLRDGFYHVPQHRVMGHGRELRSEERRVGKECRSRWS